MRSISDILDPQCISLELKGRRKQEVIAELVDLLCATHPIGDPENCLHLLAEREKLSSTGIGGGVAIPHKLMSELDTTLIAFGRKQDGIPFESIDNRPVQVVFLILGPQSRPTEHLQLLSRLSRLLHDGSLLSELLAAGTADEIIAAISSRETS